MHDDVIRRSSGVKWVHDEVKCLQVVLSKHLRGYVGVPK